MTPIHELLNRIRWDKDFGSGQFEIGYLDRHQRTVQRVGLENVVFSQGDRRAFELTDPDGQSAHPTASSARGPAQLQRLSASTLCSSGMEYPADGLGLRPDSLNDPARQREYQRYG